MVHRSEEHTSELQSHDNLVCRLLLEKKKTTHHTYTTNTPLLHHTCLTPHSARDMWRCAGVGGRVWHTRSSQMFVMCFFFFFNDTAPPEIYPLSLHDALPILTHKYRGYIVVLSISKSVISVVAVS